MALSTISLCLLADGLFKNVFYLLVCYTFVNRNWYGSAERRPHVSAEGLVRKQALEELIITRWKTIRKKSCSMKLHTEDLLVVEGECDSNNP
jgi:hypothetical protein